MNRESDELCDEDVVLAARQRLPQYRDITERGNATRVVKDLAASLRVIDSLFVQMKRKDDALDALFKMGTAE